MSQQVSAKWKFCVRIEENEFYEESSRTITFFVAPGDGGKSNELERFSVVVEDLQGVNTIGPVPKGRAITISASLGLVRKKPSKGGSNSLMAL